MQHPPPEIPIRLVPIENFVDKGEKTMKNTRSNHVLYFNDCKNTNFVISMNQKFHKLIINNCQNCSIQVLDSCVITTRECDLVNCSDVQVLYDCIDIRLMHCVNTSNCTIQFTDFSTILDNAQIYWHFDKFQNNNNSTPITNYVQRTNIQSGVDPNKYNTLPLSLVKGFTVTLDTSSSSEANTVFHSSLPDGLELTTKTLVAGKDAPRKTVQDFVREIQEYQAGNAKFDNLKNEQLEVLYNEEIREFTDTEEELVKKVKIIADAIRQSQYLVIHTGAGVSTSANIPDYRGPQGVWTLRNRGTMANKEVTMERVRPTLTHFAIAKLISDGVAKYLCSSNLDGLHRRSGVPADKIAEMHGNCYIEYCATCGRDYLRDFDTLLSRNDRWTHLTGRKCDCGGNLKDTIIHFTENLNPRIWSNAVEHSRKADTILVLGTSLNVNPGASLADKPLTHGGKLFIVNLQRTPFDDVATCKVYARTDHFMELLMQELNIPVDTSFDLLPALRRERLTKERWALAAKLGAGAIAAVIGYWIIRRLQK